MEIDSAVDPLPQQQPSTSEASTDSVNQTQSSSSSMGIEESQRAATAAKFDDDEEEEEDICRICRNPGDAENPLRYPCACSGSIKFVHQDCLLQWLNHSNARQCEVCKHPFSFSPVYSENAPARLPFQEFVVGMTMKTCHVLQFFLRLSFVLSVWLLIIPFITDYFRHLRELGGQDAEREDVGDRNGAHAARQHPGQANRNVAGEANAEDAGGAQGIAGAGQIIQRDAENAAARWEMQAARLEAHVDQMFDGLDDADGAEDVPFDELVGMQGPVFHLVENAFTVLASNMIFLGAVIFVPFSLGRIILYYISWFFSSASVSKLPTVMPLTDTALSLANITLKNVLTAVANLTSHGEDSGVLGEVADMLNANASGLNEVAKNISSPLSAYLLKGASGGTSQLSDVTTLAIGYMFIFSLVFFYLGIIALIRYNRGEPLTMGRFYGVASITETIPSFFRQFLAAMRHLMTMIKVAFLLVIELGVFPLMCGWWLDGIAYMLHISIFVSLLRGVLRQGVLYFLRDPADPNYNPFRDLIDDPVHKHARRVLLSVAVYGSLIVMLVFLPVKLAMIITPSIFPLDISVSDPFTEIPADMLLFQICIPFAIEHFQLRTTIKSLLHCWFTAVGWALGLTDFILPGPEDNDGQDIGNAEQGRQDRLQAAQLGGQNRAVVALAAADDQNRTSLTAGSSAEEEDSDEQSDAERYSFALRIVLLLVVAWMTLLIFNSALIIVPISLGRALFNAIPLLPITHGIKCNDLYAFVIGSYVIWMTLAGARYLIEQIRTKRATVLFSQVWKWCSVVLKSLALLSIWIFVIPVLIGTSL
ncbi:hypothetical protein OIU85_001707 [Salix viminalis]|uniref:RING-type E3 ubiquitin transferase n=1 Tax=Salix viminalis TaxID=40686 RepID=A0A9Q0ZYD3_SALVM|nr:hypothetical protein OIU85_001707 [Salix viminalis]